MKKFLLCAAMCVAPFVASAADMPFKSPPPPPPPVMTWTGGYLGVVGSYLQNRNGATETDIDFFGNCNNCDNLQRVISVTAADQKFNSKGLGIGGTIGYNLQVDRSFVIGVEADLAYLAVKGSRTDSDFGDNSFDCFDNNDCHYTSATVTSSSKMNWFATVRARAGFLITPSTLVFASGGLAAAQVENSLNINGTTTQGFFIFQDQNRPFGNNVTETSFRTGWTAGGGIEQKVGAYWTLKAEYLYYDIGHSSVTNTVNGINAWACCAVGGGITKTNSFEFKGDMVRIGANYKLN